MLRLLAPLFGFAVFGALFAGLYLQPDLVEKRIGPPKFRLAPLEAKPDFIEPGAFGENVSVNITVLRGGPIDVYLIDMQNLTDFVLNGTQYGFQLPDNATFYNESHTRQNVTVDHNFTFVADGANRWGLLFVSQVPLPEDWENLTEEERETHITEVYVNMRYLETEERSVVIGYVLAAPSVGLVLFTLYVKARRQHAEGSDQAPAYQYPRDKGL